MEIKELRGAMKRGIPVIWEGKHDYERAIGKLTGIVLRSGPGGEDIYSCEITSKYEGSGRTSVVYARAEEVRLWNPLDARG